MTSFLSTAWRGLAVVATLAGLVVRSAGGAPPGGQPLAVTDVVLLDFSATWCGPCRAMTPLVDEIAAAGWVVRRVDVDREADLVRRFAVTGVPCYVLLVKGQEIDRINGATTRVELERLLAKSRGGSAPPPQVAPLPAARNAPGIPVPPSTVDAPLVLERGSRLPPPVPASIVGPRTAPAPSATRSLAEGFARPQRDPRPEGPNVAAIVHPADRAALEAKVVAATARLRVEGGGGVSLGTGTVIDGRQGEALILTCGHIFRDSAGKGRVEVDLFSPRGERGLAGQVIAWDLKRDLALVSVFTESPVAPVRVGGVERSATAGEAVLSVGCNGGQDPTVHHSTITAVDKYLGPANVQVAGQPVQGRSGGGLFGADGTLIGVCNAADPTDNEGLFAALPAIHEQLDEAGLAFVYRTAYPSNSVAAALGADVPAMPAEMPSLAIDRRDRSDALPTASTEREADGTLSAGERELLDQVRRHGGRAEVICIVRPHGASQEESEVYVLQGSGRGFVDRLAEVHGGRPTATGPAPARLPAGGVTAPASAGR
ncbi:MAG: trypsin-like peptidase domain-containing protein [Planctomycetota bacterium]